MTKLMAMPALKAPRRPLRMADSAQKMGMLLPHRTKLKGRASSSLGTSIPPSGHSLADARRKK